MATHLNKASSHISLLGLIVCKTLQCLYGKIVDPQGIHHFSCHYSDGRLLHYTATNNVIRITIDSTGLSILDISFNCGDRHQGDIRPFTDGRILMWNATCSDTFAPSVIDLSAIEPGLSVRKADVKKWQKYPYYVTITVLLWLKINVLVLTSFFRELGKRNAELTGNTAVDPPVSSHFNCWCQLECFCNDVISTEIQKCINDINLLHFPHWHGDPWKKKIEN